MECTLGAARSRNESVLAVRGNAERHAGITERCATERCATERCATERCATLACPGLARASVCPSRPDPVLSACLCAVPLPCVSRCVCVCHVCVADDAWAMVQRKREEEEAENAAWDAQQQQQELNPYAHPAHAHYADYDPGPFSSLATCASLQHASP